MQEPYKEASLEEVSVTIENNNYKDCLLWLFLQLLTEGMEL
jgi:hypothetical protein